MAWLPKCEDLKIVVGGRNWLDMIIVYFDEYAYEQREFTRRLNGLIGEMNEACADRMAFIQELQSVVGEFVPAKTAVFFKQMMNKEANVKVDGDKGAIVKACGYFVGMCILEGDCGQRGINALCDTLTGVIDGRWAFIEELELLAYKFVPGKMTEFMKEIQDKDILNLMKLQIFGREFELMPREKDLFIAKLKGNMDY
uniref:Uncharacterized protein n=1 Tax=Tanacetum cinerariifolium TaxID=118510 RepID=A0A699GH85_TANCI|nr:hypothetical protein [Tanacetum cinerariifolium]